MSEVGIGVGTKVIGVAALVGVLVGSVVGDALRNAVHLTFTHEIAMNLLKKAE